MGKRDKSRHFQSQSKWRSNCSRTSSRRYRCHPDDKIGSRTAKNTRNIRIANHVYWSWNGYRINHRTDLKGVNHPKNLTHIIYLPMGKKLGDRLVNLRTAISLLPPNIKPLAQSSVYETAPWGYTDQPNFLNLVIKANTALDPQSLLTFIHDIEVSMGRQETFRFGPRLIDLDILFYDDLVLGTPKLTIPHPRIIERAFVLIPLAEIAPDLYHPIFGKTIQQLTTGVDS